MRRRPRRWVPPPGWNEALEERINDKIKADCENRMMIFDMAPKRIRDRANARGENVIKHWAAEALGMEAD